MKLLLACTSGGHFSTMKSLQPFWDKHERIWVTHSGHDTEILNTWKERVHWLPYQPSRGLLALILNLPATFQILIAESPDLVISTGASIAVNFGYAAKILRIRYIYIESISRSNELSLSGKLVYPICDELYVQWPELTKKYAKAVFKGCVY